MLRNFVKVYIGFNFVYFILEIYFSSILIGNYVVNVFYNGSEE